MPSPGGQAVSGMVGTALGLRDEVGTSGAIPTTSPRATRPHHGGKPGMTGVGISESCPRAAARSGYARSTGWHLGRPPWGRSESGANHPAAPITTRHPVTRTPSSGGMGRHRATALEPPTPRSGRRGRRFKSCHPDQVRYPVSPDRGD